MQDGEFLWWPGKNCCSLAGEFWFIHSIDWTLHLQVSIYFGLYKILLMEKISIPWRTVKDTRNSSLLKKIKFWEDRIMKLLEEWQKVVEQNGEYIIQWSSFWKGKMPLRSKTVPYDISQSNSAHSGKLSCVITHHRKSHFIHILVYIS